MLAARALYSAVLRSISSGTQCTPSVNLMVPASWHSLVQIPGVVGRGVVVVVVVVVGASVVVVVVVVVVVLDANSRIFSALKGVVGGVGHPVNSVVALKIIADNMDNSQFSI
jgi:hypothetical protein